MFELLAAATQEPIHWAELGLRPGIDLGFFTLRYYSLAYLAGIVLGAGAAVALGLLVSGLMGPLMDGVSRERIIQFLQQDSHTASPMEETKRQLADLVSWIDQVEKTLRTAQAQAQQARGRQQQR